MVSGCIVPVLACLERPFAATNAASNMDGMHTRTWNLSINSPLLLNRAQHWSEAICGDGHVQRQGQLGWMPHLPTQRLQGSLGQRYTSNTRNRCLLLQCTAGEGTCGLFRTPYGVIMRWMNAIVTLLNALHSSSKANFKTYMCSLI